MSEEEKNLNENTEEQAGAQEEPEETQAKPTPEPHPQGNFDFQAIIDRAKGFQPLTLAGLGLALLFAIFFFINNLSFRWWLMLPLAGAAGYILNRQRLATLAIERKTCLYSMYALAVVFVLRDAYMASRLAEIMDGFRKLSNFL